MTRPLVQHYLCVKWVADQYVRILHACVQLSKRNKVKCFFKKSFILCNIFHVLFLFNFFYQNLFTPFFIQFDKEQFFFFLLAPLYTVYLNI